MFRTFWDDLVHEFLRGRMVSRLILLNSAVFVMLMLVKIFLFAANGGHSDGAGFARVQQFLVLSSDWMLIAKRPWVIITHMFLHFDFRHILFNMLALYWFGGVLEDLIGKKYIFPVYLLGGIFGALLYFLAMNYSPLAYINPETGKVVHSIGFGASGAVLALLVALATLRPGYIFNLMLIGPVKVIYLVLVFLLLDWVGIVDKNNTGGHVAHMGGAFFGFLFIVLLRRDIDLSVPVNNATDWLISKFQALTQFLVLGKGNPKNTHQDKSTATRTKKTTGKSEGPPFQKGNSHLSYQEQLDSILDKIKESGYESLTAEEKEFLFNAKNNL